MGRRMEVHIRMDRKYVQDGNLAGITQIGTLATSMVTTSMPQYQFSRSAYMHTRAAVPLAKENTYAFPHFPEPQPLYTKHCKPTILHPNSTKAIKTTMSVAHYTVPIPESATICSDWSTLCEEARLNYGHGMLNPKHGGYVFEDNGVIRLVCTDDLCAIINEKSEKASTVTFHDPAAGGVKIGNYTLTLPDTARVVSEWTSLRAAVLERPHAPLLKKYGGWIIEEDGVVVIACDEEMSRQCDECPEQLEFIAEDLAELLRTREGQKDGSGR